MKLYDFKVKDNKDNEVSLKDYKGKILLIVNTATGCGFTPQYEGLQKMYDKYKDQGFEILDFPCNQFANQASGTDQEINEFCTLKYNTTFKRFKKVLVNGDSADRLWDYIKNEQPYKKVNGIKNRATMKAVEKISHAKDNDIRWNFTKFLIDKEGNVVERFEPIIEPSEIEKEIEKIL